MRGDVCALPCPISGMAVPGCHRHSAILCVLFASSAFFSCSQIEERGGSAAKDAEEISNSYLLLLDDGLEERGAEQAGELAVGGGIGYGESS